MNRIPDTLRVGARAGAGAGCVQARSLKRGKTDLHPPGAGVGASASAGVLAEAVRRRQAEVAVPK